MKAGLKRYLSFRDIKSDLDSCRRFGNSTRSDAQALRRQIDLAQEPQQAEKETQHRRDEQRRHWNRRIKAQDLGSELASSLSIDLFSVGLGDGFQS